MTNIKDLVEEHGEKLDGYFVSMYSIERCYGGPEEGGWWYDWYVYVGASYHETREQADEAANKALDRTKNANRESKRDRDVAYANIPEGNSPYLDTEGYIPTGWGDGGELTVHVEQYPPGELAKNQERPHYC